MLLSFFVLHAARLFGIPAAGEEGGVGGGAFFEVERGIGLAVKDYAFLAAVVGWVEAGVVCGEIRVFLGRDFSGEEAV